MKTELENFLQGFITEVSPRAMSRKRFALQALVEKYLYSPSEYMSLDEIHQKILQGLKRKYQLKKGVIPDNLESLGGDLTEILIVLRREVRRWGREKGHEIQIDYHTLNGYRLVILRLKPGTLKETPEMKGAAEIFPAEKRLGRKGEKPQATIVEGETILLEEVGEILHNLPSSLTSFIGRRREIAEVKGLIGESRLTTLTGMGGVGKSRLALQVARLMADRYRNGVAYVDLSPLSLSSSVVQAVASSLHVREEEGVSILPALLTFLKVKELLLVLDNCERVVGDIADLVERLLGACPSLRVLTTSREVLRIPGEAVYVVPPFEVPPSSYITLQQMLQFDAVQMFLDRGRAVNSRFILDVNNGGVVGEICRRLEGIPLAIELAAARLRTLSVEQIAQRMEERFQLLTGGARTARERHKTLRATLDWSYELLSGQERRMFACISVFSGGFTLQAAEEVCADVEIRKEDILNLLSSLVEKSMLSTEMLKHEVRYCLLDTLKEYGVEKLRRQGDLHRRLQERHFKFYLTAAEALERTLSGEAQQEWQGWAEREHDNFRSAFSWALEWEPESAVTLACALGNFWDVRGFWSEGLNAIALVMNARPVVAPDLMARAWLLAGRFAFRLGENEQAWTSLQKSLKISQEIGDRKGIATALDKLGNVACVKGDHESAFSFYEQSLALWREVGDKRGMAATLHNLGDALCWRGDYSRAREVLSEGLAIWHELKDKPKIAGALINLGNVASLQGDNSSARNFFEECLAISRQIGDRRGIALALNNLGVLVQEEGHLEAAKGLHEKSLEVRRGIGDRRGIASSLLNLGFIAVERRAYQEARARFEECWKIQWEIQDRNGIAYTLLGLAMVLKGEGNCEGAARLLGIERAVRETIQAPLPPSASADYEHLVSSLKSALGEDRFTLSLSEGRAYFLKDPAALSPGKV